MPNPFIRVCTAVFATFVLCSSRVAAGDSIPIFSSVVYGEFNVAPKDQDYYATVVTAFNRDIGKDGFLFRAETQLNSFDYNALFGAGTRYISGTEYRGGVLLGYQIVRDGFYYNGYAGADYQNIRLSPDDPYNQVRGEKVGAKISALIVSDINKPLYVDLIVNYSTAFDTYFVRTRAGLNVGNFWPAAKFVTGPEGSVFGDSDFNAQRMGLFVLIPFEFKRFNAVNIIAASGYQWVSNTGNSDSTGSLGGGTGAYATLSFSMPF